MSLAATIEPAPARIRATPYARRLARERNVPLTAIAGTGPNGRITGDDLKNYKTPAAESQIEVPATPEAGPSSAAAPEKRYATPPSAIAARVEFAAALALLSQIGDVREGVAIEDICLKAAALALDTSGLAAGKDGIVLLAAPDDRQFLGELRTKSVSAIAALRANLDQEGSAGLAVSFLGKPGIRPVAARLVDGIAARLVVGAADRDGGADCLLSFDPDHIHESAAEDFVLAFRELVESPFRLLV